MGGLGNGPIALPADGMEAVPRQLAASLPEGTLRLRTRVEQVEGTTVVLQGGGRVQSEAVAIATDWNAASVVRGALPSSSGRVATTVYYGSVTAPFQGPWLLLNG